MEKIYDNDITHYCIKGDTILKQFYGMNQTGNLKEAVKGLHDPKLLLLLSNEKQFSEHVLELETLFPNVPSIGCIGMSYSTHVVENGVSVIAFCESITAVTNVLENASTMPVKYISRIEDDLRRINASAKDTVCIDFCSGNDACVLTTVYSVLGKQNIPLVGGTGDAGKVSVNGKIYEDAAAYALVKNNGKNVKVYKENLYKPLSNYRFIASKTDRSKYILGELNGKPAKQVYLDALHISEREIATQTFKNPLGKMNGQDVCIISIKEVVGNTLACYRQVNDSDVLTLLELQDYNQIVNDTISQIRSDFHHISGIFSINCIFRYLLFKDENHIDNYLKSMSSLGAHAGLIGYGEHYNSQFVNQTMTCVVFE